MRPYARIRSRPNSQPPTRRIAAAALCCALSGLRQCREADGQGRLKTAFCRFSARHFRNSHHSSASGIARQRRRSPRDSALGHPS
jgi:hypothetical protein